MYTQLFKHGSTDGRPTPKIAVLQPAHQTIVWPSKYQEQLVSLHMISPNAVIRTTRAGGRFLRRVISKDISNYVTFGSGAPRLYERIWVDPRMCRSMTTEFQWDDFGTVVGGDWDLNTAPLLQDPRFSAAVAHWRDGIPWASTGIYDHVLQTIAKYGHHYGPGRNWTSHDDVVRRYQDLDEIFGHVNQQGRFKTQAELSRLHFREAGGVLFHIDRELNPVFGGWGAHRLAIAITTDLPVIPAWVGVVHRKSQSAWRDRYSQQAAQRDSDNK